MYVSVSRLRVEPSATEELVEAFRSRVHLVDHFDGFLGLEVWLSDQDMGEVLMVSRWNTRADFTAYMKSTEHKASHARVSTDLKAAIRLEQLEHLTGYEVVAQ